MATLTVSDIMTGAEDIFETCEVADFDEAGVRLTIATLAIGSTIYAETLVKFADHDGSESFSVTSSCDCGCGSELTFTYTV